MKSASIPIHFAGAEQITAIASEEIEDDYAIFEELIRPVLLAYPNSEVDDAQLAKVLRSAMGNLEASRAKKHQ